MKRIFVFIITLFCFAQGYAQKECDGGDKNSPKQNDPTNIPSGDLTSQGKLSYDPNEVIGPEGYDSVRWVSINDVLNYTIMFENDPEFATAAAQKVDVRFNFQNKAWMKGFGIGNYSFSNMSFPVDKPSNAYQQRIDVKDSLSFYVDLIGGLDVAKQQGFWTFTTIDPETGYAPIEAERGLLPVNDSTHVGEGAVTFQLKPYEGLKTGDTISIQANIVFDQNDTIPTNRWVNTIDAGMPESKLEAELHPTLPNTYKLTFTGKDDEGGSGVRHILLYLANHNGIYEEIDTCTVDSVLLFPAEAGKQYKLYSIAVDNTGNREPAKEEPDLILNFNQAPTDIALSDTIFQDDLTAGGYVGRLTSVDSEDEKLFTYALAEGEGAIHNDFFQIADDQLQIKESFKSMEDSVFLVRISTTDNGGLSYAKPFTLHMKNVLIRPKTDTLTVIVCHDETFIHHGVEYSETGIYRCAKSNDYMRDSTFVINLTVLPHLSAPTVTVEGACTLVSSSERNNQWFKADGSPIADATEQAFTPTEDGIYYVAVQNGDCYSEASKAYRVQLSDHIDLGLDLAKGWNWVSTNLSDEGYKKATDFVKPIESKVERLVGFSSELVRDPKLGLVGNLNDLDPAESYLLEVNEAAECVWSGTAYKPETTPIALKRGWNWLGYVPVSENTLAKSLETLSPVEGDVIKGYDAFATFSGGKWVGTLESMTPGLGYMYFSGAETTFHYPTVRVFEVIDGPSKTKGLAASADNAPWHLERNKYPFNMTMIAGVYANDGVAPAGYYTIGAFVGEECRGIGQYVEDKLFMTIYGDVEQQETITFKAFDNATMEECAVTESIEFGNAMVGSMASPFTLTVNGATGMADMEQGSKYTVYPNPVRTTLYINGDIHRIKSVAVIAGNGMTVAKTDSYSDGGMNVSNLAEGAYIAVLNTDDGIVVKKIYKVQ